MGNLYRTDRLNALTDGITAVALTLLVLDIELPDPGSIHDNRALVAQLAAVLPRLELWIASFFAAALLWGAHHAIVGRQRRMATPALTLGLLYAAALSLLPFSITLAADYPDFPASLAWFWGNVFIAGAAMTGQVLAIRRQDASTVDAAIAHPVHGNRLLVEAATVPMIATLGIALAFVHPRLSMWGWVPLVAIALVASPRPQLPDVTRE